MAVVTLTFTIVYFLLISHSSREKLARSFQNVFDKCSRVLNSVESYERRHVLGYVSFFLDSLPVPSLVDFGAFLKQVSRVKCLLKTDCPRLSKGGGHSRSNSPSASCNQQGLSITNK